MTASDDNMRRDVPPERRFAGCQTARARRALEMPGAGSGRRPGAL